MRDADRTWALLVGIDQYDSPAVPPLDGAVADALAARRWLLGLGVPDEQIILHAAPTGATAPALGELHPEDAREQDVWASLQRLAAASGEQLFVFLSGHGLYEPVAGPVFLTRDFGVGGAYPQLGIEAYAQFLRSLPFARQFVFLDGCLNYPMSPQLRPVFVPRALYGHAALPAPRPDVQQTLSFACGQGDLAVDTAQGGLFLRHLLRALDPAALSSEITTYDASNGDLQVDLDLAMTHVAEAVQQEANLQGRQQRPQWTSHGPTPTRRAVVRLPQDAASLSVQVPDDDAGLRLTRLRIDTLASQWRRVEPTAHGVLALPVESRLPKGVTYYLLGTFAPPSPEVPEAGTRTTTLEVLLEQDRTVVLRPPTGELLTIPHRGIVADSPDTVATRQRARWSGTGPGRVRLLLAPGGVPGLVGQIEDVHVQVGDQQLPVSRLRASPTVEVPPGPVQVRLVLPWGRFEHRLVVTPGETEVLRLPARVGVPPLRVLATASEGELPEERFHVLVLDRQQIRSAVLVDGAYRPESVDVLVEEAQASAEGGQEPSTRLLEPRPLGLDPWRTQLVVRGWSGSAAMPLNPYGTLALHRTSRFRVEPLSRTGRPEWDLLVSTGRLGSLDQDMGVWLVREKWEDPLLGVAGAYACLSQQRYDLLREVLDNLRRLASDIPDLAVLEAALTRRTDGASERSRDALLELRQRGVVPAFRWGVSAALDEAVAHDLSDLVQVLEPVRARLHAASVWTAWRPWGGWEPLRRPALRG